MKKEDIKVSVVVPVYNAEKSIRKCVESILAQTYSNIEVILVDDGSLDESGTICDTYAERDIRVHVLHKENGGVSSARNAGIKNATGQYLFFVDSDDWLEPGHIEMLLPIEGEDLVYGGRKFFLNKMYVEERRIPALVVEREEWMSNFTKFGWGTYSLFFVSACYDMEIIRRHNVLFDVGLQISEDGLFNLEYLMHCKKIRYSDSATYCYEDGDEMSNSLSHRFQPKRLQASMQECKMKESLTGKKEYMLRWWHWKTVFRHWNKWKKIGNKKIKKDVRKLSKESYRDKYFRECIPYIRKYGSLDEKIETYFMKEYLYWLYKPCYGVVTGLYRLKHIKNVN